MKKIITILTFTIIAFVNSDLKAQSIMGPTTVKVGEMNYFWIVGSGSFAPDAFWFQTSPYTPTEDYNYYRDNSYNNEMEITFNEVGTFNINVYYGGWSNLSASAHLAVTVIP